MSYCNRCGGPVGGRTHNQDGVCAKCVTYLKPKRGRPTAGRPVIHDSVSHQGNKTLAVRMKSHDRICHTTGKILGYSNAVVAGDAAMQRLIGRIEHNAQHGTVRTFVRNGKPVPLQPPAPKWDGL